MPVFRKSPAPKTPPTINRLLVMKICPALAWLAAFPILSPAASASDVPASPPPATAPSASTAAPGSEKKTELEMRMDRMGKAFRNLKKQDGYTAHHPAALEL